MKKLIFLILCICSISMSVYADSWRFDSQVLSGNGRPIAGQSIEVCINPGLATTGASVTSNIAILTMSSNPVTAGFVQGETLIVAGFTGGDTYFNGTYTTLSVTSTTIAYALTHANASAGTNGTARQTGDSVTGCAPLATIYTDYTGTVPTTQPITSDTLGNFGFWVGPGGQYFYQVYGPNITTSIYYVTVGLFANSALLTIGDLPPIFTTTITGTAATFNLTNAAAHTFFGNNTGSSAAPSYTAWPGSTTDLFYNLGGALAASDILYDVTNGTMTIGSSGGVAPCYYIGSSSTGPYACSASGLTLYGGNNTPVYLGARNSDHEYSFYSNQAGTAPAKGGYGTFGRGSDTGTICLNDGSSSAGVFQGPCISGVKVGTAAVPTCNAASEGSLQPVNDGMANTWGTTYMGGGSDHVLLYCDGTTWSVAAK